MICFHEAVEPGRVRVTGNVGQLLNGRDDRQLRLESCKIGRGECRVGEGDERETDTVVRVECPRLHELDGKLSRDVEGGLRDRLTRVEQEQNVAVLTRGWNWIGNLEFTLRNGRHRRRHRGRRHETQLVVDDRRDLHVRRIGEHLNWKISAPVRRQ